MDQSLTGHHGDPRVPRWWLALVAVVVSPVILVQMAHGAQSFCEGKAMDGSSSYSDMSESLRAWPPGVRCTADLDDGTRLDVMWPINW